LTNITDTQTNKPRWKSKEKVLRLLTTCL